MLSWQQAVQLAPELACVPDMLKEVPLGALPVSGGLTNRGWRIATKSHGWVIYRGVDHHSRAFDIDRYNEGQILQMVEKQLPCNRVIAHSASGLVINWIEGYSLANKRSLDNKDVVSLAVLMVKTHQTEVNTAIRQFHFSEKMDHYWSQITDTSIKSHYQALYQRYRIAPPLNINQQVLCHFDFGPHNIIVGQQALSVIDWEYAALAPASLDLALAGSLLEQWQHPFVEHYCRHYPQLNAVHLMQDINTWQPYAQAMAVLWYLVAAEVWQEQSFVAQASELRARLIS